MADNNPVDPFVAAVASHISEVASQVGGRTMNESVLSDIIRDINNDTRGFSWEDLVELGVSVLSRAARDARQSARGGSPDAKAAEALDAIVKKLDHLTN